MKKITLNLFALAAVFFTTGCSKENIEEAVALDAKLSVFEGQNIGQNQLVGTWNILSMNSNVGADLNSDGKSNRNLLDETACFDGMYFFFDSEGVLETEQGRISVADENLTCDGQGLYIAAYEVSGNDLKVTLNINGEPVTFTKNIGLSNDANGKYLHVAVNEFEVEQFINDPGNTVASDIESLELIFVKQ